MSQEEHIEAAEVSKAGMFFKNEINDVESF